MKWTESGGGMDFEQAPTGAQVARCIRLIDIGTQENTWEGKINHKRQVVVSWELPHCLMTEGESAGKPFIVSKFYTASLSEKATLRHDLVAWRGREFTPEELAGFDSKNIIGKTCMLGSTEGKNGKTRVTTVMQLPKGMPVPEQINPTLFFSLDEYKQDVFDSLGKGMKGMIEKSPEYQSIMDSKRGYQNAAAGLAEMHDDKPWDDEPAEDIPF
jgi:hypothetical protein